MTRKVFGDSFRIAAIIGLGLLAGADMVRRAWAQYQPPATYGATPNVASNGTITTSSVNIALPAKPGATQYLCGWAFAGSATTPLQANVQIAGIISGNFSYFTVEIPATGGVGNIGQIYSPCLAAYQQNQAITLETPALGTGGAGTGSIWGYYQ